MICFIIFIIIIIIWILLLKFENSIDCKCFCFCSDFINVGGRFEYGMKIIKISIVWLKMKAFKHYVYILVQKGMYFLSKNKKLWCEKFYI